MIYGHQHISHNLDFDYTFACISFTGIMSLLTSLKASITVFLYWKITEAQAITHIEISWTVTDLSSSTSNKSSTERIGGKIWLMC